MKSKSALDPDILTHAVIQVAATEEPLSREQFDFYLEMVPEECREIALESLLWMMTPKAQAAYVKEDSDQ